MFLKRFIFRIVLGLKKIAVTTSNEPFCASSDYHFSCFLHFLMHFIFDFLLCTELLLMFQWTPDRWYIDVIFSLFILRINFELIYRTEFTFSTVAPILEFLKIYFFLRKTLTFGGSYALATVMIVLRTAITIPRTVISVLRKVIMSVTNTSIFRTVKSGFWRKKWVSEVHQFNVI